MSQELRKRIFDELDSLTIVDPHTHINAREPASKTLADVLGYHYYTELAHSAGMPREHIEHPGLSPKEKVGRLVEGLGPIENTIQGQLGARVRCVGDEDAVGRLGGDGA